MFELKHSFRRFIDIIETTTFKLIAAILLISYNLYEIFEDVMELAHEHILIILGVIILVHSILVILEQTEIIASIFNSPALERFSNRLIALLDKPNAKLIIGVMVIIVSLHALYVDVEKMESKSISIFIGALFITKALYSNYNAVRTIQERFKNEDVDVEN